MRTAFILLVALAATLASLLSVVEAAPARSLPKQVVSKLTSKRPIVKTTPKITLRPRPKPLGARCRASGPECASGCCFHAACSPHATCFGPPPAPPSPPPPPPPSPSGPTLPAPIIVSSCQAPNQIHLTFDDGPIPPFTQQVQDLLASRGYQATFFVIGTYLQNRGDSRDLLLRASQMGHCIADHTMTHADLTTLNWDQAKAEIVGGLQQIQKVLGVTPRYFRFPYGASNQDLLYLVNSLNMQSIGWNVDPQDWMSPENSWDQFAGYIDQDLSWYNARGYVSLTHDYKASAPEILQILFQEIDRRGLHVVDAETCFGLPCYA